MTHKFKVGEKVFNTKLEKTGVIKDISEPVPNIGLPEYYVDYDGFGFWSHESVLKYESENTTDV